MKPREVAKMLARDGWYVKRRGPVDHVQYAHATKQGKVTLDMGSSEIPIGTLRSVFRQAGLEW